MIDTSQITPGPVVAGPDPHNQSGKWVHQEIRVVVDGRPGHFIGWAHDNDHPFGGYPAVSVEQAKAKRRAAGISPTSLERLARAVQAIEDAWRQAVALLACCLLTAGITALLWCIFRGIRQ